MQSTENDPAMIYRAEIDVTLTVDMDARYHDFDNDRTGLTDVMHAEIQEAMRRLVLPALPPGTTGYRFGSIGSGWKDPRWGAVDNHDRAVRVNLADVLAEIATMRKEGV